MKINEISGATPLDPESLKGLIPNLTTQAELNEFEAANIIKAMIWARKSRKLKKDLLSLSGILLLHRKMFGDVWNWAGTLRTRQTNVGVDPQKIQSEIGTLLGDIRYWIENQTYPLEEISIRFHHRLVIIHPFPNGNGRCCRLLADLFLEGKGFEKFTWGGANLISDQESRKSYIQALRKADKNFDDIGDLLKFAKS